MIKTLSNIFKQDKEKFVIPRSVQQVIPIETIWSDGIFKIGRNKFARTYKFTDINYAVASKVDKETMFLEYMDLLNSFDCGGTTKITINNRRLNKVDFEKAILIPMQEDGLDLYRKEYNNMLLDKATSSNSMVQEKRLLGVETNITNWQRRQNANNNFSAVIPYDLEQQRNTSKYLHGTDGIYHKCRCRLWSGEIWKFACTVRQ